jgi:hypothetical protein
MTTANKQFLVRTGVNLPAGTVSQAPLTFQQGINNSPLVNGSVEWDGYNLSVSELSSNNTHNVTTNGVSANTAVMARRTVAYIDSTMTGTVTTIASAKGTTQATAVPILSDFVVISSADNQTITAPYSGVYLPPTLIGRTITLINTSGFPIYVYPTLAVSTFSGTCIGTIVTVTSTATLQPNMILTSAGAGFVSGTKIVSILSATTFAIDISQSFTAITLAVSNAGQSNINGLAVNTGMFQVNPTSTSVFTAVSLTAWVTSGGTYVIGNTNNLGGVVLKVGDIIVANDIVGGQTGVSDVIAGSVLLSNGANALPVYGKVGLTTHVTGNLPVANGGTGTNGSGLTASGVNYDLLGTGVTGTINVGSVASIINIGTSSTATNIYGNTVIGGNLTINGGSTISNSAVTAYADAIIELHQPITGWQPTDDGKDIGLKYHNQKSGHLCIGTQVVGNGTIAIITLVDLTLIIPIGTIITITGFGAFNGTYRVSASAAGSVSFLSATNSTVVGTVGTVKVVTTFTLASGSSDGTSITLAYTGPAILAGNIITVIGFTTPGYNGTWTVATAAVNSITITAASLDTPSKPIPATGSATGTGSLILSDRYAFSGWTQDSQAFEFYEEGYEIASSNQISGIYGTIKTGSLILDQASSISHTELIAGALLSIPAMTTYDTTTVASGIIGQGSIVNIGQYSIGALNTSVTYTNMASVYIANSPTNTTNLAITNAYALQIAAGNTLLGGDLAVNGGDLTTAATTFNLINTNAATINAFGAATTINIGGTAAALTIGTTSGNTALVLAGQTISGSVSIASTPSVATANIFNTVIATGNLFGSATAVNVASSATASTTMTLGGGNTGNTFKIGSTASGSVNLTSDVTTGSVNLYATTTTGSIIIGGGVSTVGIGTGAGNAILEIRGNTTSGTATINVGAGTTTATLFNTIATTINAFGAATTVHIANSSTGINIAESAASASTIAFGSTTASGNKISINTTGAGSAIFDTNAAGASAELFPTVTTGTVKIAGNAATMQLQNTSTVATTMAIATGVASTLNNTLTYGGAVTSGINKININAGINGIVQLDTPSVSAAASLFPTIITGSVTLAASGQVVNISTSAAVATLTFGGAISGNNFKIRSTSAGTVNVTTDVTSGQVNLFQSVADGVIMLGGTLPSTSTSGNVKLSSSPSNAATGAEVITAKWAIANIKAIETFAVDASNAQTSTNIDNATFLTSTQRSSKYIIQASQIGSTSVRSQTSELLVTHDAPFVLFTNASATNSATLTVSTTAGMYVGMTVEISSGSVSDVIPTVTTIVTVQTSAIILSNTVTISATAILKAYVVNPNFSITINAATGSSLTISIAAGTGQAGVAYPGMQLTGAGILPGTYITAVSTAGVLTLNQLANVTVNTLISGSVGIYMTEYAVIETNGTIATYSASVNSISPFNIQLMATPSTSVANPALVLGTLAKTIFRLEKEMIELM